MASPRLDTAERRRRLVRRHALDRTAVDVLDAVRRLLALHSSDPITPPLALRARVADFSADDLDRALAEDRTVWRLHGMRRTLFVVCADEGPHVQAASQDIAAKERKRVEGWVEASLSTKGSGADWLAPLEADVLRALEGGPLYTRELSERVPALRTRITLGSGKWVTEAPIGSRLLFLMAMDGRVVRGRPAGSWRGSQYAWSTVEGWFGAPVRPEPRDAARARLLGRYLATHGPVTLTDLRWWSGWTARVTSQALAATGAVEVALDDGAVGYVLPDDTERTSAPKPSVALLPGLDSTPMGYKERDFFLGPHGPALFDRNGNVGPTVWVDGRVVGGWAQRPGGEVVVELLEPLSAAARRRVDREAAALTAWLDGVVVTPRFRTPLEKRLSAE